jgi:hypothetical protein
MKYILSFGFLLFTFNFSSYGQDVYLWQVMQNKDIVVWGKSQGDEFFGNTLDESKWSYNYDWGKDGYGNGEYSRPSNFVLDNGILKLITKQERFETKGIPWLPDTAVLSDSIKNLRVWQYSNAVLFSKKKYLHGIYECRFKTPPVTGTWPAFWIYAGNPNKEIDMYEGKGERNSDIHIDVHNTPKSSWFGGWIRLSKPLHEKFATVRTQWDSNLVILYVNDNLVSHYFGSLNIPGNLITNSALVTRKGSKSTPGDFNYPIDSTSKLPCEMLVDYIRIWEKPVAIIARSTKSIISQTSNLFSDTSLAAIEKNISVKNRKKRRFRKYEDKPQFEICVDVNSDKRSIEVITKGNKDEAVSFKILDSKGVERFFVPEIIESKYTFISSYIGGNTFKVKIKFSNQEVEQEVSFKSGGE